MKLRNYKYSDNYFIHTVRNRREISATAPKRTIKIINYENQDIGYIERKGNIISIAIYPEFWGKGLGTKTLKRFTRKGDIAEIMWGNKRSEKVFKKAGFKPYVTRFIKT